CPKGTTTDSVTDRESSEQTSNTIIINNSFCVFGATGTAMPGSEQKRRLRTAKTLLWSCQ
ncbi:MAG: hypothetical protein LLF81_11630, partial [Porphyromonadaceae bacterium]|nr:hypothetical protein [Porphyromonadaceae bacterium]